MSIGPRAISLGPKGHPLHPAATKVAVFLKPGSFRSLIESKARAVGPIRELKKNRPQDETTKDVHPVHALHTTAEPRSIAEEVKTLRGALEHGQNLELPEWRAIKHQLRLITQGDVVTASLPIRGLTVHLEMERGQVTYRFDGGSHRDQHLVKSALGPLGCIETA